MSLPILPWRWRSPECDECNAYGPTEFTDVLRRTLMGRAYECILCEARQTIACSAMRAEAVRRGRRAP